MVKNVVVILFLIGLVGWGIYSQSLKNNQNQIAQQAISQQATSEIEKNLTVGLESGNSAPDFQLETMDGKTIKLSDQRGKIIFLNFWASWCPPCKAEMPHMEEFYKAQNHQKVEILSVNLTTAEKNKLDVENFVKNYGLTFPVLLDVKGKVGDQYKAFTIPTTYIVDTKGVIRQKIVGPLNQESMKKIVSSIQ